jgi:hypothetical protein
MEFVVTNDTIVFGNQGTGIYISKDGLLNKKIVVELIEFYNPYEIIFRKLTTTSNNSTLLTGGMIDLKITSNGKPIDIKNNKIKLMFPVENKRLSFPRLFYGIENKNKQINWEVDSNSILKYKLKTIGYLKGGFEIILGVGKNTQRTKRDKDFPITSYFADLAFSNNENVLIEKSLIKELVINFKINTDNSIKSISITQSINDIIDNKIIKHFEKFLKDSASVINWGYVREIKNVMSFSFWGKSPNEDFNKQFDFKYKQFDKLSINNIKQAELNYYIFNANKLGLINCDFFDGNKNKKINLYVRQPRSNKLNLMLVFNNAKSYLRPKYENGLYVFENIPKNIKTTLIALKYEHDEALFAKKTLRLKNKTINKLEYADITLGEIKDILNNLN